MMTIAHFSACGSAAAPLLGTNLVRLLYLDEAGTDAGAPWMCVAGVLVHGDKEWPEVDLRIKALIDKYIPAPHRDGFVFHATDVFHGSGYFDRRKPEWNRAIRAAILSDLAAIINDLHLPVVWGKYEKDKFGAGVLPPEVVPNRKSKIMHQAALADCLVFADKWLARYSPDELATVVHEDEASVKRMIKLSLRVLRSVDQMEAQGLSPQEGQSLGFPLKRIIDTVHFAEKADARPLQLADLCAFILGRKLKGARVQEDVLETVLRHLLWSVQEFGAPPA